MYNRLLISKSHEQPKEGTVMRPDLAFRLASYLRRFPPFSCLPYFLKYAMALVHTKVRKDFPL